jgi:hypothetical protein
VRLDYFVVARIVDATPSQSKGKAASNIITWSSFAMEYFTSAAEETRLAVEQKDTKINKSKPKKHTKSRVQFVRR